MEIEIKKLGKTFVGKSVVKLRGLIAKHRKLCQLKQSFVKETYHPQLWLSQPRTHIAKSGDSHLMKKCQQLARSDASWVFILRKRLKNQNL